MYTNEKCNERFDFAKSLGLITCRCDGFYLGNVFINLLYRISLEINATKTSDEYEKIKNAKTLDYSNLKHLKHFLHLVSAREQRPINPSGDFVLV